MLKVFKSTSEAKHAVRSLHPSLAKAMMITLKAKQQKTLVLPKKNVAVLIFNYLPVGNAASWSHHWESLGLATFARKLLIAGQTVSGSTGKSIRRSAPQRIRSRMSWTSNVWGELPTRRSSPDVTILVYNLKIQHQYQQHAA